MTISLPLFYFKPSVCWIDDDQCFLDAVNITLNEHYNCLTFTDPNKAIDFLNSYEAPLSMIKLKREFTESDIFGTNDRFPVDINISEIRKIAGIKNRGAEIAVIIIDYNMPNMNGLEVCAALKDISIKKILLTGEATHEKAIEAFNSGLIDKFIKKDIHVSDKIRDYIDELIYEYFQGHSSDIVSHIEASNLSIFSDHHFIKFFNEWCQNHNIEEFYLINKNGCFLLKDKNKKAYYFIVMSESDKKAFIHLNDELFEEMPDLLHDVSLGKKIPFFGIGKESWEIDIKEWINYFYKCQIISGRENYYFSIISEYSS